MMFSQPEWHEIGNPVGEDLTSAKILVVDDSTMVQAVISSYLRNRGFTNLVFAPDGRIGLQMALEHKPELIITDLIMPNMDGFELCRQVRALPEIANTPILVETGLENTDERMEVFAAGASDLLSKPFTPRELVGRVKVHLSQRRLIRRLAEFHARMASELEQARLMQESLLPTPQDLAHIHSAMPVELSSTYIPSIALGGDFWGVHQLGEKKLRLFTVDFSGHGVGAAINTFRLQTYLMHHADQPEDPAEWLHFLNEFLCQTLPSGQFATAFMILLDLEDGCMKFASAGAPPPMMRISRPEGFHVLKVGGLPLGITRLARFETGERPFGSGSALVLYSDALIETPDPPDAVFTPQTMADFLNQRAAATDRGAMKSPLTDEILEQFYGRLGPVRPQDDLTLVALVHR